MGLSGGLNGNLPDLLTLLCCRGGGHQGLPDSGSFFRNNKRTKRGYPTCGSDSSDLYKDFVKGLVAQMHKECPPLVLPYL